MSPASIIASIRLQRVGKVIGGRRSLRPFSRELVSKE
jgi:hypothetical protein